MNRFLIRLLSTEFVRVSDSILESNYSEALMIRTDTYSRLLVKFCIICKTQSCVVLVTRNSLGFILQDHEKLWLLTNGNNWLAIDSASSPFVLLYGIPTISGNEQVFRMQSLVDWSLLDRFFIVCTKIEWFTVLISCQGCFKCAFFFISFFLWIHLLYTR